LSPKKVAWLKDQNAALDDRLRGWLTEPYLSSPT